MALPNRLHNSAASSERGACFAGTVAGENLPATIWRSFMDKVTRDLPAQPFPEPAFSGVPAKWTDADPPEHNGSRQYPGEPKPGGQDGGSPSITPSPAVPPEIARRKAARKKAGGIALPSIPPR